MSIDIRSNRIGIIIMAAGLGKRMQSNKLKVMHELKGVPMIEYVVRAVEQANLGRKPTVIICQSDPAVQNYLSERAEYVVQTEQLGTAHAVSVAETSLRGRVDHVIVLNGDMPFVTPESLNRLVARHLERSNTVTLMTTTVPSFADNFAPFYSFGRIVRRTSDGHIAKIVEKKDSTSEELEIKELNTSYFCFKSEWMWDNIKKLKNNNVQGEFYLTDLIQLAIEQGEKISSIDISPREAVGINSPADLQAAEDLV